ncbi:MAG: hypothetical protein ACE5KV_04775 [Thermoplasmata archaeon]
MEAIKWIFLSALYCSQAIPHILIGIVFYVSRGDMSFVEEWCSAEPWRAHLQATHSSTL